MGIENLHILWEPDPVNDRHLRELQALEQHRLNLIEDHRRGEHPWGTMRRDCPLCQIGR